MTRTLASLGLIAGLACTAAAQTGVRYRLDPLSQVTEEFCLGPCACPYHQFVAPVDGTFTLTFDQHGPLFDEYRVTSVNWVASGPSAPIRFTGDGNYRIGGEVAATQQMTLSLSEDGAAPWAYDSGLVTIDPQHPFPQIAITIVSPQVVCRKNTFRFVARPVLCYADCDASGALSVLDFGCFLNSFAAGDPYANCDGSTTPPTLNINDFACFLNRFAAGCS